MLLGFVTFFWGGEIFKLNMYENEDFRCEVAGVLFCNVLMRFD